MKTIFYLVLINCILISKLSAQDSMPAHEKTMQSLYNSAISQFTAFEVAHGQFIQTPNVKMHYLTWGDSSKPCLIWAHGSMFYVIAIDYYGHGQTAIADLFLSIPTTIN